MPLNKSRGNMYPWVTHTWSPIVGCPHQCSYCYIRHYGPLHKRPRLLEKRMREDLGSGNTIFVGHWCDMWAKGVSSESIEAVLDKCEEHDNTYVFQTKNPNRFLDYAFNLPRRVKLGTTIETNRWEILEKHTQAPNVRIRATAMKAINSYRKDPSFQSFETFVTIEPIFDFDVDGLCHLIDIAGPDFIVIGADSKGHGLPEPPREKVNELIHELSKITEAKIKSNLRRLMG